MGYPDHLKIQITRITIYFRPPDEPTPARKPRTPIPLVDRIFADVTECFDEDDQFVEDDIHGTL